MKFGFSDPAFIPWSGQSVFTCCPTGKSFSFTYPQGDVSTFYLDSGVGSGFCALRFTGVSLYIGYIAFSDKSISILVIVLNTGVYRLDYSTVEG